jgi:RNA polymerase sigma factor (sigma-70 family)
MQMQDLDDIELLWEYVAGDSEAAFAALVARHLNQVYSAALRHTGNAHAAEEITQAVFVILATKARRLNRRVILSGWLYETARLTALTYIRSEIRRTRREEAHMQTILNESESEVWPQIAPLLDAAMAGLNETDRHAVVLRFFDGKSMKEVGAALGANENAAKKRVSRALEKLRKFFTKRGVVSTATIIASAMTANSVQVAPATLAKTVTVVALAKGAVASASTLTLIQGALKVMAWTKMKMTIVVGVGVLLAIGTSIVATKKVQNYRHETQRQQSIIRIAPNGAIRVITPGELSQLTQSNQSKRPVVHGVGFKTGDARDAVVRQLEKIHATVLKDSPELLRAEFEKTPQNPKPMQIELSFINEKLTRVNLILPRTNTPKSSLTQPQ